LSDAPIELTGYVKPVTESVLLEWIAPSRRRSGSASGRSEHSFRPAGPDLRWSLTARGRRRFASSYGILFSLSRSGRTLRTPASTQSALPLRSRLSWYLPAGSSGQHPPPGQRWPALFRALVSRRYHHRRWSLASPLRCPRWRRMQRRASRV